MLNQIENDNRIHNKLNLCVQNVLYHEMVEHNEHNKNARNKNIDKLNLNHGRNLLPYGHQN
jgi:hypothetical protein